MIGAVTAAGFFIACAAALVSMTGNPKAGAPVVRLSLAHVADTSAPPGWRDVLPTEAPGEAPFAATSVTLSSAAPEMSPGDPSGSAIITISGDAKLDGAAGRAAAGLPQAPIAGLFAPGPGGPLPVIGAGWPDAGAGLRAAVQRRRQAARGADHRRPRPQRQGDPRGDL